MNGKMSKDRKKTQPKKREKWIRPAEHVEKVVVLCVPKKKQTKGNGRVTRRNPPQNQGSTKKRFRKTQKKSVLKGFFLKVTGGKLWRKKKKGKRTIDRYAWGEETWNNTNSSWTSTKGKRTTLWGHSTLKTHRIRKGLGEEKNQPRV